MQNNIEVPQIAGRLQEMQRQNFEEIAIWGIFYGPVIVVVTAFLTWFILRKRKLARNITSPNDNTSVSNSTPSVLSFPNIYLFLSVLFVYPIIGYIIYLGKQCGQGGCGEVAIAILFAPLLLIWFIISLVAIPQGIKMEIRKIRERKGFIFPMCKIILYLLPYLVWLFGVVYSL